MPSLRSSSHCTNTLSSRFSDLLIISSATPLNVCESTVGSNDSQAIISLTSSLSPLALFFTPLQYENAQIYTNTLLDAFIGYKAMYKRLGEQIAGVQRQTLDIVAWDEAERENIMVKPNPTPRMGGPKNTSTGMYPFTEIHMKFPASVTGLSGARTAIRRQMARIVNEVDAIEKDPKLATDEDHTEPFQAPVAFESRIPVVEVPERLRIKSHPLSGKLIAAKLLTEEQQQEQLKKEEQEAATSSIHEGTSKLTLDETTAFNDLLRDRPGLGVDFRASDAVGSDNQGKAFNNLDFMKKDWEIRSMRVQIASGQLTYLAISYENGLLVEKGKMVADTKVLRFGNFAKGERITSAAIEHGKAIVGAKSISQTQILGLRLFTNRGRSFNAKALQSREVPSSERAKIVERDGCPFGNVGTVFMDMPFTSGTLKGFFGRSDDGQDGKIYRLGLIWCRLPELSANEKEVQFDGTADIVAADDGERAEFERTQREEMESLKQRLRDKELKRSEASVSALEKAHPRNESQCGSFFAGAEGMTPGVNASSLVSVKFPQTYPKPPRLLYGLNKVDAASGRNRALQIIDPQVNARGLSVKLSGMADSHVYDLGCNWMTLPNDLHLETGMTNTLRARRQLIPSIRRIIFSLVSPLNRFTPTSFGTRDVLTKRPRYA